MLELTPDDGEVEVSVCDDSAFNQAKRSYSEAELTAAASSINYEVDGNALIFDHTDGMHRIFRKK